MIAPIALDAATLHPQESMPADEPQLIRSLIEHLKSMMVGANRGRAMRRDVHLKMHAVLTAEFSVEPDLPADLRVGLFAEARSYPAWVRLSNASNMVKPDGSPDIRGMAIKLMGVPGPRLLASQAGETTHDFIVITAPMFPTRDVRQFLGLDKAVVGNLWDKLVFFVTHPKVAWLLFRTFKRHANPLQLRYFSAVPYAFGDRVAKYGATPHVGRPDPLPFDPPENQLRQAAAAQLARGDAVFDFCVQLQTDPRSMPVEDASCLWSEQASPFRKVATLRIPAQAFDTDARNAFGENLSFTPWRCLPEHRPLGGINRARRIVYETLSVFRHASNQVPRQEPAGWDIPER